MNRWFVMWGQFKDRLRKTHCSCQESQGW